MADVKVTALTEDTAPTFDDLLYTVNDPAGTPASKKAKLVNVTGSPVNAQTGTSYTVLTTDYRKLVTHTNASAIAVTLPQAGASFPANWFYWTQNRGAGAVTITPTTSTIDGAATLVLNQNEGALIVSDGTNYFTFRGKQAGGATPGAHKDTHKSGGGDAFTSSDLLEAIVKRLQESAGPTTLTLGAVADGEYLKRSGTDIVGDTPSGGGGSVAEDPRSQGWVQAAPGIATLQVTGSAGGLVIGSPSGTATTADDSDGTWVSFTTGTTSGNVSSISTTSGRVLRRIDSGGVVTLRVKTGSDITSVRLWATLSTAGLSGSDTPSAHYFGVRYSTSADGTAFWRFATDNGSGTPEVTATTQSIAADTAYTFKFVYASGSIELYVYSGGAWVFLATHTGTLPSSGNDYALRFSVTTLTAAARVFKFGSLKTWHN